MHEHATIMTTNMQAEKVNSKIDGLLCFGVICSFSGFSLVVGSLVATLIKCSLLVVFAPLFLDFSSGNLDSEMVFQNFVEKTNFVFVALGYVTFFGRRFIGWLRRTVF